MFKSAKKFYFTVASLGGLLLMIIATVSMLQLGISSLLGIKRQDFNTQPPEVKSYVGDLTEKEGLTEDQKVSIEEWQKDYDEWRDEQKNFDWDTNARKEQLAMSLSFLIVGLPVFLYHVRFVRKEEE